MPPEVILYILSALSISWSLVHINWDSQPGSKLTETMENGHIVELSSRICLQSPKRVVKLHWV